MSVVLGAQAVLAEVNIAVTIIWGFSFTRHRLLWDDTCQNVLLSGHDTVGQRVACRPSQQPVFRPCIVPRLQLNNLIPEFKTLLFFIFAGVPKSRRGEIWQFLALQYRLRHRLPNKQQPPDISYKELLKQLTAQQHAILVDLGMSAPLIIVQKWTVGPFVEFFGGILFGFLVLSLLLLIVCFVLVLLKKMCWIMQSCWHCPFLRASWLFIWLKIPYMSNTEWSFHPQTCLPKRVLYLNHYKGHVIGYYQFLYFEQLTFVWDRHLFSSVNTGFKIA